MGKYKRFFVRLILCVPVLLLAITARGQQMAVGMASSSTSDSMSYADAKVALRSFEERNFIAVADRVVCTLNANPKVESAIGEIHERGGAFGLSGAENSSLIYAPITYAEMRYAVALLGRYAHQKYVIVFATDAGGTANVSSAKLATLHLPATPHVTLERVLDESGVIHRTLADDRTVVVLLLPGDSEGPIRLAARKLHGTVEMRSGVGEIFGDDNLEKALATYDRIIAQFEMAHPQQALSAKLWTREWHDATSRTCTATKPSRASR